MRRNKEKNLEVGGEKEEVKERRHAECCNNRGPRPDILHWHVSKYTRIAPFDLCR